ncbi:MAG: Yellowstone lake phycodnavirus 1 [Bacteroidota bacterium]|jgi:hypothetical protein
MKIRPKGHWGPYLWGFIHTITMIDYDNNETYNTNIREVLRELKDCFPCPSCKDKYINYLEKLNNLNMQEPLVLFKWSVELHNEVNRKLNKPEWTYEMALMKWGNQIEG